MISCKTFRGLVLKRVNFRMAFKTFQPSGKLLSPGLFREDAVEFPIEIHENDKFTAAYFEKGKRLPSALLLHTLPPLRDMLLLLLPSYSKSCCRGAIQLVVVFEIGRMRKF